MELRTGMFAAGAALMFAAMASAAPEPEPPLRGPLYALLQDVQGPSSIEGAQTFGKKAKTAAETFGDLVTTKREIAQEAIEIRINVYAWRAKVDTMTSLASSDDIRAGAANGYVPLASTTTRDFHHDFGLSRDPRLIFNPEITARFTNTVIRMSWWTWEETGNRVLTENIPYGDLTYTAGNPVKGKLKLTDTKVIYEYRWLNSQKLRLQFFNGLSLHYLEYRSTFDYQLAWGWAEHGCPIGQGSPSPFNGVCPDPAPGGGTPQKGPEKRKEPGDYGLVSISTRIEWEPIEGVALTFDSQSMYLPTTNVGGGQLGYGYTDTKIGIWVQYTRFIRVGFGERVWAVYANVDKMDRHDTIFRGRATLSGAWCSLMILFP